MSSPNRSTVDVYGGQASVETDTALTATKLTLSASGNVVGIDGNCAGNVYGGQVSLPSKVNADTLSLSANNNTVNYSEGNVLGILYGGLIVNGTTQSGGTGNTLNVEGSDLIADNIANFNKVNFDLPANATDGTTLLTLNGGNTTNLSGTQINTTLNEGTKLADGDVVHILTNDATITTDAATQITNPRQGLLTEYVGAT